MPADSKYVCNCFIANTSHTIGLKCAFLRKCIYSHSDYSQTMAAASVATFFSDKLWFKLDAPPLALCRAMMSLLNGHLCRSTYSFDLICHCWYRVSEWHSRCVIILKSHLTVCYLLPCAISVAHFMHCLGSTWTLFV